MDSQTHSHMALQMPKSVAPVFATHSLSGGLVMLTQLRTEQRENTNNINKSKPHSALHNVAYPITDLHSLLCDRGVENKTD